jgi:hypothetical protein
LKAAGVSQLSLAHQPGTAVDQGNLLGLVGSYQSNSGEQAPMVDVWFQIKELDAEEQKRRMALLGIPPAPTLDPNGGGGDD